MAQMDPLAVEPVRQAGAAGTRALAVVGPEHDVVGQQLRAPLEQVREALLAVLGVEDVLLLNGHPRELAALARDLLVELRLLGLELRELVARRLPLLAGSGLVVWQLHPPPVQQGTRIACRA